MAVTVPPRHYVAQSTLQRIPDRQPRLIESLPPQRRTGETDGFYEERSSYTSETREGGAAPRQGESPTGPQDMEDLVEPSGKRQYDRDFLLGFQFMPVVHRSLRASPSISDGAGQDEPKQVAIPEWWIPG
ncbi:eukaryotic translation initiation factor 4 gamma 3 isoform X1 [Lates japonicus]|uniref:Eukaryotic translation initiation factor 4 gamma 3 isoform X1 n=1 Tax=Lates japonicus TaxID=270547 RepID=A0AAD3RKB6_LATJO|nr:eukaryotic translation initiation factor 4 gamma 3 isoform X1 [Lates japonicus]